MRVFVEGAGLAGPGLDGWAASRNILAGEQAYQPAPVNLPPHDLLPANERRRAVQTVRIALAAGADAFAAAGRNPAQTATIFTSSGGDGETIHQILTALAATQPELSPTRFHNSVHNAPSGYWSIATGSQAPSTSLCCHDDSFAAGLLEAAVQAATEHGAVALIAYDVRYPEPLGLVRPIGAPFAISLVLAPERTGAAFASLELTLGPARPPSTLPSPDLESLRCHTPAARGLPLLAALTRAAAAEIVLAYFDDMALTLRLTPC